MSANVALSDTFDTWRNRTNKLLTYTQTDGGTESLKIANTTDSTSNTTGAFTTTGGAAFKKTVYIGENHYVQGNTTLSKDISISGNTTVGSDGTDVVVVNASLNSDLIPLTDTTSSTLGSATKRFGALFVNGVIGDATTGSVQIPAGTSAQRSGETGSIRWNTELSRFEGNTGTNFESLTVGLQDQDGDTKIVLENSADEDTIRFFTGNTTTQPTERINISTAGNVAIGTGASYGDAKLQVSGTANVSGTVTLGTVLLAKGNVTATGAFVNATTTDYITLSAPTTTIDSHNTIVTGNLVVEGTSTYVDSTNISSKDKTIVLAAGSDVFKDSSYTAADPTTITSKKNGSTSVHGLTTGDKILILKSDDTTAIPTEELYAVTVVSTTTFTIDLPSAPGSGGTLDFVGPQTDSGVDDAGIVIAGNTVHRFTWDDADDSWSTTDPLNVTGNIVLSGDVKLGNNRILASDGGATIVVDDSDNVTIGNNLTTGANITLGGNIIKASDGATSITTTASSGDVSFAGDITVGGNNIKSSSDTPITLSGKNVTVEGTLTAKGNVTSYEDVNGADVTLALGTSAAESLVVEVKNDSSAKTLSEVNFISKAASTAADKGKFNFKVDETTKLTIDDAGIDVTGAMAATGAVSGTTGTFSGAVSGTTGSFSGLVTCNGGLTVQNGDTFTFDGTGFTTANNFQVLNSSGGTIFSGYMLN